MAIFVGSGVDELIKALDGADLFDENMQMELLTAGADNLSDTISEEAGRAPYNLKWVSPKLNRSKKVKKDKNGANYITVSIRGKNERGERNATVAFVLNYGRREEYGKIPGSYFWTRAVNRAEKTIPSVYERIVTEKFKERGLI